MKNSIMGQSGMRGPKGVSGDTHPFVAKILTKYHSNMWRLVCFLSRYISYFKRWK